MKPKNAERIAALNEKRYKEMFGVTKPTFDKMLEIFGRSQHLWAQERRKKINQAHHPGPARHHSRL
jgi:hypothetical protein